MLGFEPAEGGLGARGPGRGRLALGPKFLDRRPTGRRRLEKTVTRLDRRRGTAAKNLTSQVEQASTQIENAVQNGIKETSELASRVQERVLNRA